MPDQNAMGPAVPGPQSSRVNKQLDFPRQDQQQTFWCWAAVTAAVDDFMNPGPSLKQCEIANFAVNTARKAGGLPPLPGDACQMLPGYNTSLSLHPPLVSIGRAGNAGGVVLTFEQIQHEIDQGLPIGVRIEWEDGTGHFVTISGYSMGPDNTPMLMIQDPDPKSKTHEVPYNVFLKKYRLKGKWTETHLVERGPVASDKLHVRTLIRASR